MRTTPCPRSFLSASLLAVVLAAASGPAKAGRPLSVDDANTNDAGAGHVEMWVSRAPGSTVLNVAPAYAPIDGLEFGVAAARDTSSKVTVGTVQLKWRITPSQEVGCNLGTSLGASRVSDGGGHLRFLNGLVSCNFGGQGSVHLNLGVVKPSDGGSVKTWGVAYERETGPVTPHLEFFGEKGGRPTAQVGLRGQLAEAWQLDGTVGRHDGQTLYSVGVKFQF
jgi:hypothetical protein